MVITACPLYSFPMRQAALLLSLLAPVPHCILYRCSAALCQHAMFVAPQLQRLHICTHAPMQAARRRLLAPAWFCSGAVAGSSPQYFEDTRDLEHRAIRNRSGLSLPLPLQEWLAPVTGPGSSTGTAQDSTPAAGSDLLPFPKVGSVAVSLQFEVDGEWRNRKPMQLSYNWKEGQWCFGRVPHGFLAMWAGLLVTGWTAEPPEGWTGQLDSQHPDAQLAASQQQQSVLGQQRAAAYLLLHLATPTAEQYAALVEYWGAKPLHTSAGIRVRGDKPPRAPGDLAGLQLKSFLTVFPQDVAARLLGDLNPSAGAQLLAITFVPAQGSAAAYVESYLPRGPMTLEVQRAPGGKGKQYLNVRNVGKLAVSRAGQARLWLSGECREVAAAGGIGQLPHWEVGVTEEGPQAGEGVSAGGAVAAGGQGEAAAEEDAQMGEEQEGGQEEEEEGGSQSMGQGSEKGDGCVLYGNGYMLAESEEGEEALGVPQQAQPQAGCGRMQRQPVAAAAAATAVPGARGRKRQASSAEAARGAKQAKWEATEGGEASGDREHTCGDEGQSSSQQPEPQQPGPPQQQPSHASGEGSASLPALHFLLGGYKLAKFLRFMCPKVAAQLLGRKHKAGDRFIVTFTFRGAAPGAIGDVFDCLPAGPHTFELWPSVSHGSSHYRLNLLEGGWIRAGNQKRLELSGWCRRLAGRDAATGQLPHWEVGLQPNRTWAREVNARSQDKEGGRAASSAATAAPSMAVGPGPWGCVQGGQQRQQEEEQGPGPMPCPGGAVGDAEASVKGPADDAAEQLQAHDGHAAAAPAAAANAVDAGATAAAAVSPTAPGSGATAAAAATAPATAAGHSAAATAATAGPPAAEPAAGASDLKRQASGTEPEAEPAAQRTKCDADEDGAAGAAAQEGDANDAAAATSSQQPEPLSAAAAATLAEGLKHCKMADFLHSLCPKVAVCLLGSQRQPRARTITLTFAPAPGAPGEAVRCLPAGPVTYELHLKQGKGAARYRLQPVGSQMLRPVCQQALWLSGKVKQVAGGGPGQVPHWELGVTGNKARWTWYRAAAGASGSGGAGSAVGSEPLVRAQSEAGAVIVGGAGQGPEETEGQGWQAVQQGQGQQEEQMQQQQQEQGQQELVQEQQGQPQQEQQQQQGQPQQDVFWEQGTCWEQADAAAGAADSYVRSAPPPDLSPSTAPEEGDEGTQAGGSEKPVPGLAAAVLFTAKKPNPDMLPAARFYAQLAQLEQQETARERKMKKKLNRQKQKQNNRQKSMMQKQQPLKPKPQLSKSKTKKERWKQSKEERKVKGKK